MTDDPRCCGSGTCIIDLKGRCWCGQQWDDCLTDRPPVATEEPIFEDPVSKPIK
jgi:hypothetical protein